MKCEFCNKIGIYYSVDIEHGGTVPEEFDRFEVISSFQVGSCNFPDEILRCPECNTFYHKKRRIDNEINNWSDEIDFEEITRERMDKLVGRNPRGSTPTNPKVAPLQGPGRSPGKAPFRHT